MSYAMNGPNWIELQPGRDVIISDVASSYETVTRWTPQMRTARGIKAIIEDAIPDGKIVTGSTLVDDKGTPRRVWILEDAPPALVPQEISETQFIRACVILEIITAAEGEAYLARGELPAMMAGAFDQLPEPQRTDARLKAIGSVSFSRGDDVFKALVACKITTDDAIDAVFKLGATLS